jgi:biotin carboxyl carrier protein
VCSSDLTTHSSQKEVSDSKNGTPLLSPLSGTIHQVCKKAGDKVNRGDVLLIVEAMKMETEIQAANDGVISQVFIKKDEEVKEDQKLMLIE